jgi:hypothetical protein
MNPIDPLILSVRGEKVILDEDLARIYRVSTSRFNEAVKRNAARFPSDFRFQVTSEEWETLQSLRSQIATLKTEAVRAGLPAGSRRGLHRKYLPYVFTEHGALMAANVLRSPRAVEMSVYVIRAFVRMRQELAVNRAVSLRLAEIDKILMSHDGALRDLYAKIRPLLLPSPSRKPRELGFHTRLKRGALTRESDQA